MNKLKTKLKLMLIWHLMFSSILGAQISGAHSDLNRKIGEGVGWLLSIRNIEVQMKPLSMRVLMGPHIAYAFDSQNSILLEFRADPTGHLMLYRADAKLEGSLDQVALRILDFECNASPEHVANSIAKYESSGKLLPYIIPANKISSSLRKCSIAIYADPQLFVIDVSARSSWINCFKMTKRKNSPNLILAIQEYLGSKADPPSFSIGRHCQGAMAIPVKIHGTEDSIVWFRSFHATGALDSKWEFTGSETMERFRYAWKHNLIFPH